MYTICDQHAEYVKTLRIEWNANLDHFCLTVPHLELCGAYLLAHLLHHVKQVFDLFFTQVYYAWTDSTIILSWLIGNPRCFNTYVANRVSHIVELIAPDRWNHICGTDNPALRGQSTSYGGTVLIG